MHRNRAIEGTVTGAKFKFLSTKDFPFIVSRTKKIFALEVIFTFISRIDKFPRKMKSSYFITPSCSVSVSSLHFARLGRHIEYSRANGTCVTTRRRSYPFYRQCPCLNGFQKFIISKVKCLAITVPFLAVVRAGGRKESASGNCPLHEMPNTRSGEKSG